MAVTIIVPYSPGQAERDRNWEWVHAKYQHEHPDWAIVTGSCLGPWVKALAVRDALAQTPDGVCVVADADVWSDDLLPAVGQVIAGAPWAIPHRRVRRLTPQATERFLDGEAPARLPVEEAPYVGAPGGGLVILHRRHLDDIPLDPRFVGWGGEDRSWGRALRLLLGEPWRGTGPLWHLWHPPQERQTRSRGSDGNHQLRRRYDAASRNVEAMRRLVQEIQEEG